jgi:hypothetical protein
VLNRLPARNAAVLTGKQFFPNLIADPFHHGLIIVFSAAIAMSLTGALISLLRGRQFYYEDAPAVAGRPPAEPGGTAAEPGGGTVAPVGGTVAPVGATSSAPGAGPVAGGPGPGSGPD